MCIFKVTSVVYEADLVLIYNVKDAGLLNFIINETCFNFCS